MSFPGATQRERAVSDKPVGQRFSHVYMERPELLADSSRLRRRLAALYVAQQDLIELRDAVVAELGLEQNQYLQFPPYWQPFLDKVELRFRNHSISDYC